MNIAFSVGVRAFRFWRINGEHSDVQMISHFLRRLQGKNINRELGIARTRVCVSVSVYACVCTCVHVCEVIITIIVSSV